MKLKNADYDKIMQNVSGPLPWSFESLVKNCSFDNFEWIKTVGSEKLRPKVLLKNIKTGSVVLVLNFYCYVQKISYGSILIWFTELDTANVPICIKLIMVNINDLNEIHDLDQIFIEMDKLKKQINCQSSSGEEIRIPVDIIESRDIKFPDKMKQIDELLIVSRNISRKKENADIGDFAIYKIYPKNNFIKVEYQDWFNYHGYDLGYVWITRVGRDSNTNNIIGEGFRIPKFILNEDGDKFIDWVRDTPGYF